MAGWPSIMLLPSYTPTIALHSARTNRSSGATLFYCPGRSEARCDDLDTGLNMLLVGCVGFTGEEGLRGTGGNVMLIPGIYSKVRPPHSSLRFPSFPQEAHSPVAIYGSYKQSQAQCHSVPNLEGYPVLMERCNTTEDSQKANRTGREEHAEAFREDEFTCSIPYYCPPNHLDITC